MGKWIIIIAAAAAAVSVLDTVNSGAFASSNTARPGSKLIQAEFNGLPFDPDFETWRLVSTTQRDDDKGFRFILRNAIATEAMRNGNIRPWPDGTRFAKLGWTQELGPDHLVHPGKFLQIGFMVKDAHKFVGTEGWAWGRWVGPELKPYSNSARFVEECTGCHLPLRQHDYVFTLPISPAKVYGEEIINNRAAALPSTLPYQPLGLSAVTMYVDPSERVMATVFGNETATVAVRSARRTSPDGADIPAYSTGSVLAIVTWTQQRHPEWSQALIPESPTSVEFLEILGGDKPPKYSHFAGSPMSLSNRARSAVRQRTLFVMQLAPVQLPPT